MFFFYRSFFSQTLAILRTAREGRGLSFIPLYHLHSFTNTETFIWNFPFEMTITYFSSQRLCLPDCYSTNYHLIDWLMMQSLFVYLMKKSLMKNFIFCAVQTLGLWLLKLKSENLIKRNSWLFHALIFRFCCAKYYGTEQCNNILWRINISIHKEISDAQDPSPSVTYEDKYSTNCTIIRTWTATDHAGNVATKRQKLKIVSFSPIHVCKVLYCVVNYSLVIITALLVLLVGEWHFFQAWI